jgi:hypothetical protein
MFEPTQPARRAVAANGFLSSIISRTKKCFGTMKKLTTLAFKTKCERLDADNNPKLDRRGLCFRIYFSDSLIRTPLCRRCSENLRPGCCSERGLFLRRRNLGNRPKSEPIAPSTRGRFANRLRRRFETLQSQVSFGQVLSSMDSISRAQTRRAKEEVPQTRQSPRPKYAGAATL